MRPRHIAAENVAGTQLAGARLSASMRPRHIAAENARRLVDVATHRKVASMRPRHIAAENDVFRDETTLNLLLQ